MKGVDEVHLLNITVAPAVQGQGWGRVMLDALAQWSQAPSRPSGCGWRCAPSNTSVPSSLYDQRYGFRRVGERKRVLPGRQGGRP
jgi:ribosomal-protein-alanine N-acetyltransferase